MRRGCRWGDEERAAAKPRGQEEREEGRGTGGERGGTRRGRAGLALPSAAAGHKGSNSLLLVSYDGNRIFFFNVKYLAEDLSTYSSSIIHSTNIY